MISVGEFLKGEFESLACAFFNSNRNSLGDFEVVSSWVKHFGVKGTGYEQAAQELSKEYGLQFERSSQTVLTALIENEERLTHGEFLNAVYVEMLERLTELPNGYSIDEALALALFIPRGSPDRNLGFYSVDFRLPEDKAQDYVDNFTKILLWAPELFSRLNFNFRDLQPQQVSGRANRKGQVRVNLRWFYDEIFSKKKHLNEFKFNVLRSNPEFLGEQRKYPSFEQRIVFFREQVLGRTLNPLEIRNLRESLEFHTETQESANIGDDFPGRNMLLVAYARETFADECVGCRADFDLSQRSFIMPRNGRYYLEINHVVPFSVGGQSFDVLENLVKLCAICHRALTPRRASEELQRKIISHMLSSRSAVQKFVFALANKTAEDPIDYVFERLR